MDMPGGYMEADARFSNTGGYAANGGMLVLEQGTVGAEAVRWTGHVRGRTVHVPGRGPSVSFLPMGAGPYECAPNKLVIQTRNPTGDSVPMTFLR